MTQRTPQAKDRSCKVGDSVTALSNFHISPELTIPKGTRGKVTATDGHAVLVDRGMPEIGAALVLHLRRAEGSGP